MLVAITQTKFSDKNLMILNQKPIVSGMKCVLPFFKSYSKFSIIPLGTLINIIVLSNEHEDFQNLFLHHLNEPHKTGFNSIHNSNGKHKQ